MVEREMVQRRSKSGRSGRGVFAACVASILLATTFVAATDASADPTTSTTTISSASIEPQVVPGSYIVTLDASVDLERFLSALTRRFPAVRVTSRYSVAFNGFAAKMSVEIADAIRKETGVRSVVGDGVVDAPPPPAPPGSTLEPNGLQNGVTWGLDRIDQRGGLLNGTFSYRNSGNGVTAYVIDSGILASHSDLGGRVGPGATFVPGTSSSTDCNGHGSHVAGTIAGATFGVAKSAWLVPVRVFGCTGGTADSVIISGIEWVIRHHQYGRPAVANMSLGGESAGAADEPLLAAIRALIADGVSVVVAAGNDGRNACDYTPARLSSAITVGASTNTDARASFSNYGSCVDVFAPGQAIESIGISSNTSRRTLDGTSMAAPHVSGAVAAILSGEPSLSPSQVHARIIANATTGALSNIGSYSPNRLLYSIPSVTTPPPSRPVNDDWGRASTVALSTSGLLTGTSMTATAQTGEPWHGSNAPAKSIWWRIAVPSGGALSLTTQGSTFDTVLAVYTGSSVSSLTKLAGNDDVSYGTLWSQVRVTVEGPTTFYVAVDGYRGASGNVSLNYTWTPTSTTGPPNDMFANAVTMTSLRSSSLTGTNVRATKEFGEPNHHGYFSATKSVWWKFTAPESGVMLISTGGSNFDTVLAVYSGKGLGALTYVDSSDDYSGLTSLVAFDMVAGATYYVAVAGFGESSGSISLSYSYF